MRSGHGTRTAAPQPGHDLRDEYVGQWVADAPDGQGTFTGAPPPAGNGETYTGEWERGVRHGHGRCVYHTGEVYVGKWSGGVRHGDGALAQAVRPFTAP